MFRNMRLGSIPALIMMAALVGCTPATQGYTPPAQGSKIDNSIIKTAETKLLKSSEAERDQFIAKVKKHPEKYPPVVFYLMSRALFEKGEKNDAAFWFYAGQLRARTDANICADKTARQAVSVLNMTFGGPINEYSFKDKSKLEKTVKEVIAWDEKTPHHYDQRWINPHGMESFKSADARGPESLPQKDWDEIRAKTRKSYLDSFNKVMNVLNSKGASEPVLLDKSEKSVSTKVEEKDGDTKEK